MHKQLLCRNRHCQDPACWSLPGPCLLISLRHGMTVFATFVLLQVEGVALAHARSARLPRQQLLRHRAIKQQQSWQRRQPQQHKPQPRLLQPLQQQQKLLWQHSQMYRVPKMRAHAPHETKLVHAQPVWFV